MPTYAADTQVSSEKSRMEIERILRRYGATRFGYAWEEGHAVIAFEAQGRRVRFILPMPDPRAEEFHYTPSQGRARTASAAEAAWEQACRQRWRALALVIKAKLEAVEAGITEFEDEFLAHIVLPGGGTVGQEIRPKIALAYSTGKMPPMLPEVAGRAA